MLELIYRFDPSQQVSRHAPQDPADAQQWLEQGNAEFASLAVGEGNVSRVVHFDLDDFGVAAEGSVLKQQPFAVVLGCSDARVPTEMIFQQGCNDLFVVRVAGNVLGEEQLGSIDYAVENLGKDLKLLVVLGHSRCGAVTATVDAFLKPSEYLSLSASHHVRAIVNALFPAVRGAAEALSVVWGDDVVRRPGYRAALIETAVIFNAGLTASILHEEFARPDADRRIVFGVYDLGSRRVHVPLASQAADAPAVRLLDAPACRDAFRRFAADVVGSSFVRDLLG